MNKQRCVFLLGKFSRFFDLINDLPQSSFNFAIFHFVHHLQNRVLPFPEELEIPVSSAPVLRGFPFFSACLHLANTIMKTYLKISMSIQVIFPFRTSESTEGSFVTLYSGLLTEPDWFDNLRIVEPRINIPPNTHSAEGIAPQTHRPFEFPIQFHSCRPNVYGLTQYKWAY